MKKIVFVIMVCIMCLSLCACGGGDRISEEESIAIQKSEKLAELLPPFCGTWKVLEQKDLGKIGDVVVCEDGTIKVGDAIYSLDLTTYGSHISYVGTDVYDGEEKIGECRLLYYRRDDKFFEIQLDSIGDEPIRMYNPDLYEIINLTVDNWREYFEVVEEVVFLEDAFGDAESISVQTTFQIKEEYVPRIATEIMHNPVGKYVMEPGAVELNFEVGEQVVTADLAERTYEAGEFVATDTETVTSGFWIDWTEDYQMHVDLSYWLYPGLFEDGKINGEPVYAQNKNIDVNRIKLELYLMKE